MEDSTESRTESRTENTELYRHKPRDETYFEELKEDFESSKEETPDVLSLEKTYEIRELAEVKYIVYVNEKPIGFCNDEEKAKSISEKIAKKIGFDLSFGKPTYKIFYEFTSNTISILVMDRGILWNSSLRTEASVRYVLVRELDLLKEE